MYAISLHDVETAARRIASWAHRTPIMTCATLDALAGRSLFFKCEQFQKVGAFKFRGACNAVLKLDDADAKKGVVTHSSGNHAQALALAAKLRGIPAHIVMPSNATPAKRRAVEGYGANVIAPIGGGGLMAGLAIAAKAIRPAIRLFAAEPLGADDAARSKAAGALIPQTAPQTIADGLLTSMGDLTWPVVRDLVEAVVTVKEEEIVQAMRLAWERAKLLIEPSSAVTVAALMTPAFRGLAGMRKIGVVLSGGNANLDRLPW